VEVLHLLGVAALIAPSFGRQFYRNAINNGLPLIECDTSGVEQLDVIEIDFAKSMLNVAQRRISRAIPALPDAIQTLLAAGGLIPFLRQHPDWNAAR
jgi:3-isopropylmalate dehydratase small subunit